MPIPTTGNITFSQVTQELWGTGTSGKSLMGGNFYTDAFAKASDSAFHPDYKGNKDRLSNFRGYPYQITCSFTATLEGIQTTIPTFDYLVVRYYWLNNAGKDLDTSTGLVNTNIPYLNNRTVGYSSGGDLNTNNKRFTETNSTTPYMWWVGDNTNSGYESVLLNFDVLYQSYPTLDSNIKLLLTSIWFSIKRDGNVKISLTAYSGGTMVADGGSYDFTNTGGTVVYEQYFDVNIQSTNRSLLGSNFTNGTDNQAGYIMYNNSTKTAQIFLP